MADVLGNILAFAVGIAISPVPIIAVILMLFSARARINGPAFLVGWIVGVSVVTVVALLLTDASDAATDDDASSTVSGIKLVLGLLLVALAFREWRHRPHPGEEVPMPKWMSAIDAFTPVKALGTGVLLSAVNPKNLVLATGGGATIGQANGLSDSETILLVIVFVLIASATIGGAVLVYLVGGQRAKTMLDGWKVWLGHNNAAVMAVLLLVMGVVLAGKGLDVFD
jgi:threonine/homoserine/homoserine lactone efflux protein